MPRCLHSLSCSTKLLHMSIVEVWRPVLEMLSLRDEEGLKAVSEVACNLLPAFSPTGEVKHLCSIFTCEHMCEAIGICICSFVTDEPIIVVAINMNCVSGYIPSIVCSSGSVGKSIWPEFTRLRFESWINLISFFPLERPLCKEKFQPLMTPLSTW